MKPYDPIEWPDGKAFAFTIFDDTDLATLENLRDVYAFLADLGFRTTKSVWPVRGEGEPRFGGITCEDPDYLAWTMDLQARGFEIGFHGAAPSTSLRGRTIFAIEQFREMYGHYPLSMANHSNLGESIYWGPDRVTGGNRLLFNVLTRSRHDGAFRGHREGDPLFWGDVCREKVRYVRNFTFRDINTLASCPMMPYHDPERPYVNYWYAASEGAHLDAYNRCLSPANQDRLEADGGACIMYTHLAAGFWSDGRLDPQFRRLMERLARKNGWFVPVATLLDHLRQQRGEIVIAPSERRQIERRWLLNKVRIGPT